MTVIAIFNQKGGVGKTTTTLNLAAALDRRGYQSLCIDLDPQAHLTGIRGVVPGASADSVFGFFKEERSLAELVREIPGGGQIIPSHTELCKVDSLFGKGPKVVNRLRTGLHEDMLVHAEMPVLIDCCPMLGVLSLNALFACTRVLIPVSTDFLAVRGAQQLERTLKALEHVLKRRPERSFVVTRFDGRRKLSWQLVDQLKELFGDDVLETRIAENVAITESPSVGKDVFGHAPSSQGAKDYERLVAEMLERGYFGSVHSGE